MPRRNLAKNANGSKDSCSFVVHAAYWSVLVTSDGLLRLDFCLPEAGRNLVLTMQGIHRTFLSQPETPFVIFRLQGYKQACSPPALVSISFCLGRFTHKLELELGKSRDPFPRTSEPEPKLSE